MPLGVLAAAAALEVLRDLAGASRIDSQIADAKLLCEWLGYLPLGLELVGRYLASKPDLTLAELLRRLEQQKLAARALSRQEAMTATHESVAAAFELSWNDLTETQRQLGERLSLFALAPIPWALVKAGQPEADAEDLEDDRDTLINRNLLNRVGDGSYQLHSLIREFFAAKREQATDADDLTRAHCAVLVQVAQQIPWMDSQATYLGFAPVIPHLVEVVHHQMAAVSDEAVLFPANGLAAFYYGQGLYSEGVRWAERCKKQVEERLGADHPSTATSLNNLAALYESMGRYSEAEPLYGRSLEIREAQLGADHPDTATSLNNLAGLYRAMGRYSEAEPLYGRSLEIREAQLGADHPDTATSLNNLAALYESMGRYSEAEPLYGRSLAIREAQLGADHPDTATSLNNLAALYESMGRYSEAEPLYGRSLAIREAQLGKDHPATATSLNNLAALYESMGRYSEAEPLYLRALLILVSQLGQEHPRSQTVWQNFVGFLLAAVQAGRAGELSDHPLTQALLTQVQAERNAG
ncbi:tetratricopeptide repeat protein [Thermoleptolyngbya sp. PKUAC-SCTB121]|uniref:tetratricopeptide repeat protein n=1 Tax=Thermoleptolyngbya sp. PKUAC-SCTB121 TaxID=2811482 RepID=UPI0037DD4AB4